MKSKKLETDLETGLPPFTAQVSFSLNEKGELEFTTDKKNVSDLDISMFLKTAADRIFTEVCKNNGVLVEQLKETEIKALWASMRAYSEAELSMSIMEHYNLKPQSNEN